METKNSFFEIEKDLNKNKRIRTRFTVQQLEKLEGKIRGIFVFFIVYLPVIKI